MKSTAFAASRRSKSISVETFSPAAIGIPLVLLRAARPSKFSGGQSGSSRHFNPTDLSSWARARLGQCPEPVDVTRQLDVGAGLLSGCLDHRKFYLVKLERAESCLNRLSNTGADKRG